VTRIWRASWLSDLRRQGRTYDAHRPGLSRDRVRRISGRAAGIGGVRGDALCEALNAGDSFEVYQPDPFWGHPIPVLGHMVALEDVPVLSLKACIRVINLVVGVSLERVLIRKGHM
jgi:hypothetical protein